MVKFARWLGGMGLLAALTLQTSLAPALAAPSLSGLVAQEGHGYPQQPIRRSARLTRRLGLTPDQKQHILRIQRQYQDNGNRQQMWRQIRGVLTPQQMHHLRQLRSGQGAGQGERREGPRREYRSW